MLNSRVMPSNVALVAVSVFSTVHLCDVMNENAKSAEDVNHAWDDKSASNYTSGASTGLPTPRSRSRVQNDHSCSVRSGNSARSRPEQMENSNIGDGSVSNFQRTPQFDAVDPFSELRSQLSSPPDSPQTRAQTKAGDNLTVAKAGESTVAAGTAETTVLTPDKFDVVGPTIAKALRDNGVKEITIKPGTTKGSYQFDAKLDKPVTVPQDINKDGCYQLDIGKNFSAEVSRGANGKFIIDHIQGMTAKIDSVIGKRKVDALVEKIEMSKAADGTTQLDTTGSRFGIQNTRTKYKNGDVYDGMKDAVEKLDARKQQGK
jgi:hypothetical protein